MKFKWNLMRSAAAALAVTGLASCGGGTQVESFVPARVIAMGDEASLVNPDGTKFTVNGVVFTTDNTVTPPVTAPAVPKALDCASNQVWTQQVAYSFGMSFPGCATAGYTPTGVMLATAGATVTGLTSQVNTYLGGTVNSNDLVTVMVGTNDIIAAAESSANPVAAVRAAGTQVGAEVVRITDRGAKVVVSTVPNLGMAPYAISRETGAPGTVAFMSDLSTQFNTALRLKLQDVRDGGRAVGLVLADELVLAMVRNPVGYALVNWTLPICPVAATLTSCDMTTITPAAIDPAGVTANYGYDWLWADDRHLGGNAQSRLGALGVNRARNNPF
jgi:lysophospholipase L1-like esterase